MSPTNESLKKEKVEEPFKRDTDKRVNDVKKITKASDSKIKNN
jgi:hypothetical protein